MRLSTSCKGREVGVHVNRLAHISSTASASMRGSRRSNPKRSLTRRATNASLGDSLSSTGSVDTDKSVGGRSIGSDSMSSIGFRSASLAPRGHSIKGRFGILTRSSVFPPSSQHSISSLGDSTTARTVVSTRSEVGNRGRRKMLVNRESQASLGDSLHGPDDDGPVSGNINGHGNLTHFSRPIGFKKSSYAQKMNTKGSQRKNQVHPSGHHIVKPVPSTRPNSKVKFGSVSIREFSIEIGDNPSCSRGPAVTLGWDIVKTSTYVNVEKYEQSWHSFHHTGMNAPDMILTRKERERMLLENGFSANDIADGIRKILKVKNQRRQTIHNLPVARLEEIVEGAGRKVKRFFSHSKDFYSFDDYTCSPNTKSTLKNSLSPTATIKTRDTRPNHMTLRKLKSPEFPHSAPVVEANEPDDFDDIFADNARTQ